MSDAKGETALRRARPAAEEPPRVIIRPPGRWPGLALGEFWRYRETMFVLARRNIKVRYRQTVFGAAWAIMQPVLLMLVFTVFFGILGRMSSQGIPFPVFFLGGLVIWHAVSRVLAQGTTSVVQNAAVLERVYFPRVYFPLAAAIVGFVDLLFALCALGVVLAIHQIVPGWPIVLVPVLVVIAFSTAIGVTFWLSAANAAYRDIAQMMPFFTQLWFFMTPILYPADLVPEAFRGLYYLNPMALVVSGFRWAFANTPAPPGYAWLISSLVAGLLLVSGYVFFRYRERTFADVL